MTGRDPERPEELGAKVVVELLEQLSRRTQRLRSLERERDELERRLAAQQAALEALRRVRDQPAQLEDRSETGRPGGCSAGCSAGCCAGPYDPPGRLHQGTGDSWTARTAG
jgi:hypothetical protein